MNTPHEMLTRTTFSLPLGAPSHVRRAVTLAIPHPAIRSWN